jgi:tRNA(fMet)-specific endonuclease VapC
MTLRRMLDTNIVSGLIKGHPDISRRIIAAPISSLCISAITLGELRFGLAKRPKAQRLRAAIEEFLMRVEVLPWDDFAAGRYGALRAEMEGAGKSLAALDMLIAAHALATGAILVTNDGAFRQVAGLNVEDWTTA